VEYAAESHVADNPEAGEGHTPFERPLGSANGIRIRKKTEPNKINALKVESVGFQYLSLRHLAPGQISLPEIAASKITSICGLLCEKLLTVGLAMRPNFVSLGPTFSKPPDCPEKVRRR
jgi:hypothetical protein